MDPISFFVKAVARGVVRTQLKQATEDRRKHIAQCQKNIKKLDSMNQNLNKMLMRDTASRLGAPSIATMTQSLTPTVRSQVYNLRSDVISHQGVLEERLSLKETSKVFVNSLITFKPK